MWCILSHVALNLYGHLKISIYIIKIETKMTTTDLKNDQLPNNRLEVFKLNTKNSKSHSKNKLDFSVNF